jgi:hypothetical protein
MNVFYKHTKKKELIKVSSYVQEQRRDSAQERNYQESVVFAS